MQKSTQAAAILMLATVLTWSCSTKNKDQSTDSATDNSAPSIIRLSDEINSIISEDVEIETLTEGFNWSEGPVWVPELQSVLFTDVPMNTIYRWHETEGKSVFLEPSGFTDYTGLPKSNEPGANGLILDNDGNLLMCQHGDRRVARLKADFSSPIPEFETLADSFNGQRLNSPNDLVMDSQGNIYFTDPPYGLNGQDGDETKEIEFNGVYKINTLGDISLIDASLTRPNGIALSPDEKTLYVANSDPERAIWMAYDITADGVTNARVLFDATSWVGEKKGLPDGLKVNENGILFATGPGGVLVFTPEGKHLGTINTGQATANCAFGPDEKSLYMTADSYLMRISLL